MPKVIRDDEGTEVTLGDEDAALILRGNGELEIIVSSLVVTGEPDLTSEAVSRAATTATAAAICSEMLCNPELREKAMELYAARANELPPPGKPLNVVFAPGFGDNLNLSPDELAELKNDLERKAASGELQANAVPMTAEEREEIRAQEEAYLRTRGSSGTPQ